MKIDRAGLLVLVALLVALPTAAQEVEATRRFHAEPGRVGLYYLSLPFGGGLDDVAHSSLSDPCDLEGASADGLLNADDLICTIWGAGELEARHGAITVMDYRPDCRVDARTAFRPGLGEAPRFVGVPFDHRPEAGFAVLVGALDGQPEPDDTVSFTGPCEPTLPPQPIVTSCQYQLPNLPYDTLYRSADEVLCGVRDVEWFDLDEDGAPDTCPAGVFDVETKRIATVQVFVNAWDDGPRHHVGPGAGHHVGRSVVEAGGRLFFIGQDFPLVDGDSTLTIFESARVSRDWDPPVEGCD